MMPNMLSGNGQAVLIIGCTLAAIFGVILLFKSMYWMRDWLHGFTARRNTRLPVRILLIPFWLLFAIICLVLDLICLAILLLAIKDVASWWRNRK